MGIEEYISEKKKLYYLILAYIDNDDDNDSLEDFLSLINFIESKKIHENEKEIKNFLVLLLKIAKNRKCDGKFIFKFIQIIKKLEKAIKQTFSNYDIFIFFKGHKKILLQLFENQIITFDESIKQFFFRKRQILFKTRSSQIFLS